MTLNQVAYSIAERMPPSQKTVPEELLLEMLRFTVIYYRALFLRRDYGDNLRFPTSALQQLDNGSTELELVDKAESDFIELGCSIFRTKRLIPNPVRLRNFQEFFYVGGVGKTTPYTSTLPGEYVFRSHNKYTGTTPCYYYTNKRLYILGAAPKFITIQYMLADPRELACTDSYDNDSEFSLPEDLGRDIILGILTGEYKLLSPPTTTDVTI